MFFLILHFFLFFLPVSNTTGDITATLNEHGIVHEANLWHAYSCGNNVADGKKRRDFRIAYLDYPCQCGIYAEGYCANLKSMWHKTPLESTMVRGKRTYVSHIEAPEDGRWVASMIEISYKTGRSNDEDSSSPIPPIPDHPTRPGFLPPSPHDLTMKPMFTTEVSVFPQSFPYPDCTGEACGNTLV